MKTRRFLPLLALLLCLTLLLPTAALAEETPESYAVIDADALEKIVTDYCREKGLDKEKISIGYRLLETGDTWYYNGDRWYYSASMYKVPLMMLFAEMEYEGTPTQDSVIQGMTLGQAEELILVNSRNDEAHSMMNYLGTNEECRTMYQKYSDLDEAYYDPDFYEYSYFTAHFMTDVMTTLYEESERFPNVIDCLKRAQNGAYFHGALGGEYEVAQKYGSFTDRRGVQYNHTTGIIYTPHPFILTVMTENMGVNETVLRDMASRYTDYTLTLDGAIDAWAAEQAAPAAAAAEAAAEEAAEAVEESMAPAEETEPPADETAEPAEETEAPAEVTAEPETDETKPAAADASLKRTATWRIVIICACAILEVILLLALLIRGAMRKQRREEESA